ncbi:MAG: hypothetical protein N2691_00885 [Patescibacteria group bacterium]|nr:hypothetical protein [Patescibacteria group bacterium]
MPQKTRLRKILAKKRREAAAHRDNSGFSETTVSAASRSPVSPKDVFTDSSAFRADIRKTLIVSGIIFLFELGIFTAFSRGMIPFIPQG